MAISNRCFKLYSIWHVRDRKQYIPLAHGPRMRRHCKERLTMKLFENNVVETSRQQYLGCEIHF